MDEDGTGAENDAALLKYIQRVDAEALTHLQAVAPWLRPAHTRTAGFTYLAHHCQTCGVVQGDHYLLAHGGPYWPEDGTSLAGLRVVPGIGCLRADADTSQAGWMDQVEVKS
jgi:hypothetical protein